jgi:adenylate cyclase
VPLQIRVGIATGLVVVGDLLEAGQVQERRISFAYKGKRIEARRIARKLGVRYLLEGSVRRVGDSVRFTARLIDGAADAQLWAGRYDRDCSVHSAFNDDIVEQIAWRSG